MGSDPERRYDFLCRAPCSMSGAKGQKLTGGTNGNQRSEKMRTSAVQLCSNIGQVLQPCM
jgi:hypothetical protein